MRGGPLTPQMGIDGMWGRLGYDANYKSLLGKLHVALLDKKVGYELAGRGFQAVVKMARDPGRAKDIAEHCNSGEPLKDPGTAVMIADYIVADITRVASAVGHLWVVPECSFTMKRHCGERRSKKGKAAIEQKKYSRGVALPDCVIKLVAPEVAKIDNVTFLDTVIGEGEAQLMYMLKTKEIDYVLNYSGDVDTSIYVTGGAGTIINCPRTMGSIGGRKYNGVAGVSVWGKPVICGAVWKNLINPKVTDDDVINTSAWGMVERALLGAIIGHDYDSKGTDSKGQGLHRVGYKKAIPAIVASVAGMPDLVPLARVRDVCTRLGKKGDANRMMAVVTGFMYHLVVDKTGHACTYSKPTPTCLQWIKSNEPKFHALIKKCNVRKKIKSEWATHRGCTGCNVTAESLTDAIAQKVKTMLDPIRSDLKSLGAENLPTVEYEMLKGWIESSSKSDASKALREGMNRSYENAKNEGTGKIYVDGSADPPIAYVTRTEVQSQDRDPYTVVAKLELNKNADAVVKISAVLCDCYRECADVICHHRTSLLCYMWLNTLLGLAGNRTARIKYWASFSQGAKSDLAVRLSELMTNRKGRLTLEDAQTLADTSASESETEAPATKGKKRKRTRRDMDSYVQKCYAICEEHYSIDIPAVGSLARKGDIKRLSMWGTEDCSFIDGAGDA